MNILVVDDETSIQKTLAIAIKAMGHNAFAAYSGTQTLRKLEENRIDAIFLDLHLDKENGLEVFDQIREAGHETPIVMFTAYSSVGTAVEATRKGAFDYIPKPFVPEQIRQVLGKIAESKRLSNKIEDLESQVAATSSQISFESDSPNARNVYDLADRAARSDANILVLGPSGTGKSVLARRIHEQSKRAPKAFVVVHCPSLSRELLESELFGHVKGAFTGATKDTWGKVDAADGGTLFLDEIGELPQEIQAKLLRLIQDRQYERIGETMTRSVDTRIIAATNRDLQSEVEEGSFREDLYYRLNVISINMPSLAERKEDLPAMIDRYLSRQASTLNRPNLSIDSEAQKLLLSYDWPGNLRELSNTIERCAILARTPQISISDLPPEIRKGEPSHTTSNDPSAPQVGEACSLQDLEDAHIRELLQSDKSLESIADTLGIDSATLYRKRKKLGLL